MFSDEDDTDRRPEASEPAATSHSGTKKTIMDDGGNVIGKKSDKALVNLKTRRSVCEQQMKRIEDYLTRIRKDPTLTSAAEMNIRAEALDTAFRTFISIQGKIEEKDFDEISKPNRSTYEELYYLAASALKVLIAKHDEQEHALNRSSTAATDRNERYDSIKLPKIELQEFSGDVTTWISWYDEFVSLVHKNENLTTFAKLRHLVSKLSPAARAPIAGLKIVAENYEANAAELRNLMDKMNNHLTGLKNINRPVDGWDDLIVHIITSKLDPETALKWNEESPVDRLPTLAELMTFLKKRCQIIEGNTISHSLTPHSNKNDSGSFNKNYKPPRSLMTVRNACNFCKKPGHFIYRCTAFLNLPVPERYSKVSSLKLCQNCLKINNHTLADCPSKINCNTCGNKHHSLLHQNLTSLENPTTSSQALGSTYSQNLYIPNRNFPSNNDISSHTSPSTSNHVYSLHNNSADNNILGTAIVYLIGKNKQNIPCRVLLDAGSQLNMISERIIRIAGINRRYAPTEFMCVNDSLGNSRFQCSITIKSLFTSFSTTIEALVMNQITGMQPASKINVDDWNIPKHIKLSDPQFNIPQRVDLLLGVDIFYDILEMEKIKLGPCLPILVNTLLGWVAAGRLPTYSPSNSISKCNLLQVTDVLKYNDTLNDTLKSFWEVESFETSYTNLSKEERECETHFCANFTRLHCGRYQVRLPFKETPLNLGSSYNIALKRFLSLERKFRKDKQLEIQYTQFMNEYIQLSHMERVHSFDFQQPHYIIPHHCVFKMSSSTTKLRVVFDASSKTSSGISLNELLMVGPVIQPDLFTITLRFRYYAFVFTSDITKMYRQVALHPDDRRYHCILWRSNANDPIHLYQLTTVTYGTAPAAFLSTRSLQQLSLDEGKHYPLAAKSINSDFYVDDILSGANTLQEAIELQNQLKSLFFKKPIEVPFSLRKLCANHSDLLKDIPSEDRETLFKIRKSDAIKALGVLWNPLSDKLLFEVNANFHKATTKRTVLSEIAQFFDPLGLINPVIVLAKIFMQQLWRLKLDWDDPLPPEYQEPWVNFRSQLEELNNLEVDRLAFSAQSRYELHAFSDSSESAYGACIYIRSISPTNEIRVRLLCAKSKVAPVKKCCLPKLELCGAVVMAQLVKRVKEIFNFVHFEKIIFWTDSTIVLSWIKEESCNWQTFIANRVAIIQAISTFSQWRHIPSKINPADILSRGSYPLDLINSKLWFYGPDFLSTPSTKWPTFEFNLEKDDKRLERKKTKIVLKATTHTSYDIIMDIKYHNNYTSLLNVIAYILRFKSNCMEKNKILRMYGPLTINEIEGALTTVVKCVQAKSFAGEILALAKGEALSAGSHIKSLAPFIDSRGVLRVGERLRFSALDYNSKHPILLPKKHDFTNTLLRHLHIINHHIGPQTLLSTARQTFWPVHGKNICRSICRNCISCFRAKPTKQELLMGDLPELRVRQTRPFNIIGIDFCGPFQIYYHRRGISSTKGYVAAFVCFATKAIHLELVEDLTTAAFLAALKRFIGRRGLCSLIYSDNATNFIGTRNELHELYKLFQNQLNLNQIITTCTSMGITWKTIPARSPHYGGLWEAAVKSTKFHLRRILQNAKLNFFEFNTLIIQIESIFNSRPITPVPENANDMPAITPGHFIIGTAMNAFPEPDLQLTNVNRLHRYQKLQWYLQQFWTLWSREYLQRLQPRTKWIKHGESLCIGDVVVLEEENLPPLKWRLGRVVNVQPGKDGVVRAVTVKTSSGETQRAATRVRRLPIDRALSSQGGQDVEN